jgi:ketosteroid isomerase-like protein
MCGTDDGGQMSEPDEVTAAAMERFAIQEVIFRYSDAVTRGNNAQMRSVFAPDAVWESPILGMHFDTAAEFMDFVIAGSATLQVLMQTANNPVVELTAPGTAVATTTIRETILGVAATDGVFGAAGAAINVDQ